jgi:hypothetical protein
MPDPAMTPRDPLSTLLDPTPYNQAVDRGMGFIKNIPKSASNSILNASPAFAGVGGAQAEAMNQQMRHTGGGAQQQERLAFARKAGTEVPQFQLRQRLGLRGLENEQLGLGNAQLANQLDATLNPLQQILKLLGAFGGL